MRVVVAPDKFKGTADATEVAAAMAVAVAEAGATADEYPMADGGDGTLAVLGGANRVSEVTGPGGDPVEAPWRLANRTAVIEMAKASGLVLAGGSEANDPLNATTRGTGELIAAAMARGARRIIVGLGGSATTDGGLGAVDAIGSPARIGAIELEVAVDVTTEFVDAARVFGPQKGATPAQVKFLEARLRGLAEHYRDRFGVDVENVPGAGAAGGLAGGLFALGATLVPGFDLIADEVGLDDAIDGADLVITGEGRVDAESFEGKVVGGVLSLAADAGVAAVVISGEIDADAARMLAQRGATAVSLTERFGRVRSLRDALSCVTEATRETLGAIPD